MADRPDPKERHRLWPDMCRDLLVIGVPFSLFVSFGLWISNHVPWFVNRYEGVYFKAVYFVMLRDSPQLLRAGGGYATIFFIWLWVMPVAVAVMLLDDGIGRWRRYRTGGQ